MHLEIVSHSWHFHRLLTYQLSSLVINPPKKSRVTMTVCYCPDDHDTTKTLTYFGAQEAPNVQWHWVAMSRNDVSNRAIGRNRIALRTHADWVWFADADYVVGDGFLDRICIILANESGPLVYPKEVLACNHLVGRRLAHAVMQPRIRTIPMECFVPHRFRKAIGGVQFVPGQVCRTKGYCHGTRYLQPTAQGKWVREIADKRFRESLGTSGHGVSCPGLFRIRHDRTEGKRE